MTILNEKKEHIDYIKWKNVLKISRHGLVVGGSPEMVWLLGEVPRWFGSGGKSRYGLVAGGSPDMVWLLGEVPIWFCRWGKSRYGLVVGGSPDMVLLLGKSRDGLVVGGSPEMVLSLGEVPRCDVTPHIGEKRAKKIPRWKMCSNPMLEKCNFLHIAFINGRNI